MRMATERSGNHSKNSTLRGRGDRQRVGHATLVPEAAVGWKYPPPPCAAPATVYGRPAGVPGVNEIATGVPGADPAESVYADEASENAGRSKGIACWVETSVMSLPVTA